jgi:hypothetical protein
MWSMQHVMQGQAVPAATQRSEDRKEDKLLFALQTINLRALCANSFDGQSKAPALSPSKAARRLGLGVVKLLVSPRVRIHKSFDRNINDRNIFLLHLSVINFSVKIHRLDVWLRRCRAMLFASLRCLGNRLTLHYVLHRSHYA